MPVFGFRGRGPRTLSPEQLKNSEAVQQEKVDEVLSKQDARYDAMTDEQREQYYLKPSVMTKIKKSLRGGQ